MSSALIVLILIFLPINFTSSNQKLTSFETSFRSCSSSALGLTYQQQSLSWTSMMTISGRGLPNSRISCSGLYWAAQFSCHSQSPGIPSIYHGFGALTRACRRRSAPSASQLIPLHSRRSRGNLSMSSKVSYRAKVQPASRIPPLINFCIFN